MKKLIVFVVLFVSAVTVSAQSVKVTSDRSVDVAKYKTYAWALPMPPANPMVIRTIVESIEQAMAAKGLRKVETDPELFIAFWSTTASDLHVAFPSSKNPTSPSLANAMPAGSLSWPVTEGTLVVSISDAATKNGVWRATASQTLEYGPSGNPSRDAERVEKPIRKAVAKMFKKYPRP